MNQSYDGIGRLQSIADPTTTYLSGLAYNGAGQATAFNYGNGVQAAFTYNDHLELATLRYFKTGAADLLNLAYDYTSGVPGNNGQIQAVHYCTTEPVTCSSEDATKTENFTYDPWSRLNTARTGDNATWGLAWQYDRFGNRLQQNVTAGSAPAPSVTVDPATNRINSSGYAYDAAGNMTNDTAHSYTYDAANWLTKVDGGSTASYTYLGALRVKKVAGSTTTVYVYSRAKPIAEYVGGTLSKEYVYAGIRLLATIAGGTVTYQHQDHLSIRAESDANGALIRSYGHFPFGETWYENLASGVSAGKWVFTTYERDSESALDYADFRHYSSRLGRFLQADPLAGDLLNPQSLNRYTYALNDPCGLFDPTGLCTLNIKLAGNGVPTGDALKQFEDALSSIFGKAGVDLSFNSGEPDYTLNIDDASALALFQGDPIEVLGETDLSIPRYSEVASDRAFYASRPLPDQLPLVLARLGAHEAGHGILQTTDHADSGIMQPGERLRPLLPLLDPTGNFAFTAPQAEAIQRYCQSRHGGDAGLVDDTILPMVFRGAAFWFIDLRNDGSPGPDPCPNGDCGGPSGSGPGYFPSPLGPRPH